MKHLPKIIFFFAIAVIFGHVFLSDKLDSTDFPTVQKSIVDLGLNLPQAWSFRNANGLGTNIVFTLSSWPIDFIYGLGSHLGFDFTLLTKLMGVLPILLLGYFSIKKFLEDFGVKNNSKYIGIAVFLLNTYILLLIDGGQLSVALAYSWFPYAFIKFKNSVKSNFRQKLLTALVIVLLGVFDIRFVYLLAASLIVLFIYNLWTVSSRLKLIKSWIYSGIVTAVVFILLNLFWLLPLILNRFKSIPADLTSTSQLSFLQFTSISQALFISQPQWPLNAFGVVFPTHWEFFLLPVLSIISLAFSRNKKRDLFFGLLLVVGVFFVKGTASPLGEVYTFYYKSIPGFAMFRDSTKFFIFITLASSFLIASFFNNLKFRKSFNIFITLSFLIYVFLTLYPVWLKQMTGFFGKPVYEEAYKNLDQKFASDNSFGRILWIPSRPPLGYTSANHPILEGLGIADKRPFVTANVGSYERVNFLREAGYIGDLLDIAGISYVGYPFPDIRKTSFAPEDIRYYHYFSKQLEDQDWSGEKISSYPVEVFKTKKAPQFSWSANNIWWVVGNEHIYEELNKINNFDLKKNPLIFVDEYPNLLSKFTDQNVGKILVFGKKRDDVIGDLLDPNYFVNLTNLVSKQGNIWQTSIDDVIKWRSFLHEKYQLDNIDFALKQNTQVLEGKTSSEINLQNNGYLLARVMLSPNRGTVKFTQGTKTKVISTVSTESLVTQTVSGLFNIKDQDYEYNSADFHWINLGDGWKSGPVTIETEGDINVINSLAEAPQDKINSINNYLNKLETSGDLVYWGNLSDDEKENLFVSSQNIPTGKDVVVYSQSYDPLWTLNDSHPLPAYSFVNVFITDNSEKYVEIYTPQKYVNYGLVLSFVSLITVIGFLVAPSHLNRYNLNKWKKLKKS